MLVDLYTQFIRIQSACGKEWSANTAEALDGLVEAAATAARRHGQQESNANGNRPFGQLKHFTLFVCRLPETLPTNLLLELLERPGPSLHSERRSIGVYGGRCDLGQTHCVVVVSVGDVEFGDLFNWRDRGTGVPSSEIGAIWIVK